MPGTSPNVNQQAAESAVQGVLFQLLVQHRADLHQGTAPFTAPTTAVLAVGAMPGGILLISTTVTAPFL